MDDDKKNAICRVCLDCDSDVKQSKGLSLFEEYNDCVISDKINSLTNVGIEKGDGLPDRICPTCLLELESAFKFKLKCESSNEVLLSTVINVPKSPLDGSGDVADPVKVEYLGAVDIEYDEEENISLSKLATADDDLQHCAEMPPRPSRALDLKLECHDCGGSFKSKCKLRVHWKKAHMSENIKCPNCLQKFKTYAALKSHKKRNLKSCVTASKVRIEGSGNKMDCTPPILRSEAEFAMENLLPAKSKEKYVKVYKNFMTWKNKKKANIFSETVFLAYFNEIAKTKKPSTLWAIYSMLKCTVHIKNAIDLKNYGNLTTFLKRQSTGFKSLKSKVLTGENIKQFLLEAPDDKYLATKVALILGVNGACRSVELYNITTKDIESHDSTMIITLRDTKTKIDRMFVVRGEFLNVVKKYRELRPVNATSDRFFLNFKNGRCTKQIIGRHKIAKMPKEIATYLNLTDSEGYTGHCFRRSSATLTDSGANFTTLTRQGGQHKVLVTRSHDENNTEITNKHQATC